MIDVHPPHAAVHTWKDFWIHLATITIGLLIAISLEQGVEWLHHLHQRHQLEEDLREEGEKNREVVESDLKSLDGQWEAGAARLREAQSASAARKNSAPPFPPESYQPQSERLVFVLPYTAVWTTAKESARIELLPREVARTYARLYLQLDYLSDVETIRRESGREVEAYRCRFDDGSMPCAPELAHMSDEQLNEYIGLLTRFFTNYREEKQRLLTFAALNQIVLNGQSMDDYAAVARAEYKMIDEHPDTFLKPNTDPSQATHPALLHP